MALLSALVVLIEGFLASRCKNHFPFNRTPESKERHLICNWECHYEKPIPFCWISPLLVANPQNSM